MQHQLLTSERRVTERLWLRCGVHQHHGLLRGEAEVAAVLDALDDESGNLIRAGVVEADGLLDRVGRA